MSESKSVFTFLLAAGLMLVCTAACLAQDAGRQLEPSYEVSLRFLTGSNDGGKSELSADLSPIAKELKNNFAFTNYRVAGMLVGRVGSNGNYEYRSVSNIFGLESTAGTPTFLEWTLAGLNRVSTVNGSAALQGSAFRFGAKVPIMVSHEDAGRTSTSISYENVGITAMRFGLTENTPTLIGTLSLPGTPGTIFLVMTARTVD